MAKYIDPPNISKTLKENVKRLPIVLCEDISASMKTKQKLMNEQLMQFFEIKEYEPAVCRRTDLTIVQFNDKVSDLESCSLDKYIFKPFLDSCMRGTTHLWSALEKALDICETYIGNPQYWAPWILLYTDGFANDEDDEVKERVLKKLQEHEKNNELVIFILGIGAENSEDDSLNIEELNEISLRGPKIVLHAKNQELDIARFFQVMIRTITQTVRGMNYVIRTKDGNRKQALDELIDAVSRMQQEEREKANGHR